MWTEVRMAGSFCWTNPEFPGYEIEKFDDEPFYRVFAPGSGAIGKSQKFAHAVLRVEKNYEEAVQAYQRQRQRERAVREAAAELGCDESEIF